MSKSGDKEPSFQPKTSLDRRPLYVQLAANLEEMICREMNPGDKLPPEYELAKTFGVSSVTMREALTSLVRGGLIQRRRGSGSFIQERTHWRHVAILMPRILDRQRLSANFSYTYDLLCRELDKKQIPNALYVGRLNAFADTHPPEYPELEDAIHSRRVRAVVNLFRFTSPKLKNLIHSHHLPFLTTMDEDADVMVHTSTLSALKEGVRHLAAHGRKKLAFLYYKSPLKNTQENIPRLEAFREALEETGLPYEQAWVRDGLSPGDRGSGWSGFREIWSARQERPDAIIVSDESFFPDVATAILEMRLQVPQQLEVITQSTANSDQLYPFPVGRIEVDPTKTVVKIIDNLEKMLTGEHIRENKQILEAVFIPSSAHATLERATVFEEKKI